MHRTRTTILSIFTALILTGCSAQKTPDSVAIPDQTPVDWRTEGFHEPETKITDGFLWPEGFVQWEEEEGYSQISHGVTGSLMWNLRIETHEDDMSYKGPDNGYILDILDLTDRSSQTISFTPEDLGVTDPLGQILEMDVVDRGHYVFRWMVHQQEEENQYQQTADFFVFSDLHGNNHCVDYYDAFLKESIETYEACEGFLAPHNHCNTDGKGNLYTVIQRKETPCFYLFDQSGDVVLKYEGRDEQLFLTPLRTAENELILTVYDMADGYYDFLWADMEKVRFTSLLRMEAKSQFIQEVYCIKGNDIYYRHMPEYAEIGDRIVKWNMKTGEQTYLFDYGAYDITSGGGNTYLSFNEAGKPFLRYLMWDKDHYNDWYTLLVEDKPERDHTIQIVSFLEGHTILSATAAKTSRVNPNYEYESAEVVTEEEKSRILADMTQGKGPDMLYVSCTDFLSLRDKGALLDLNQVITPKLRNQLLPAVLEMGNRDGHLYGMPTGVYADTFVVAKDSSLTPGFKIRDVVEQMNQGKLKTAIRSPYGFTDYLTPEMTVSQLIYYNLEDPEIIDWSRKTCHFDSQQFVRLLELTSKDLSRKTAEHWFNEETDLLWAHIELDSNLAGFLLQSDNNTVKEIGYCGSGNGGGYLSSDGGFLVINANTVSLDAVRAYLEMLVSEEVQSGYSKSCLQVRKRTWKDSTMEGILNHVYGIDSDYVLQDGTLLTDRMEEFLESCEAKPLAKYDVNAIIHEELSGMYNAGKSAATAATIQNRVQLYINENY